MHFILFHDFYLSQSILCWNLSYLRNLLIKIVVLHSPKKLARASSPIHCKCSEVVQVISGVASRQHRLNGLHATTAFPLYFYDSKMNLTIIDQISVWPPLNSETVADMEKYICEHCVFYTKTVRSDLRF